MYKASRTILALFVFCAQAAPSFADEVSIVAINGEQVPGGDGQLPTLSRFTGFPNTSIPLISDSGHVMFTAELVPSANIAATANKYGIWRANPDGTKSLVARIGAGAWAPPISSLPFSSILAPMVAANGDVTFKGVLAGTGVTTANANSYWMHNGISTPLMVREGEVAPGAGSGATLGMI